MDVENEDEGVTAEPVEGAHLTALAGGDRMNTQLFEIEPGAEVPEHSHENEQVGYMSEGTLTFVVDGEEIPVGPGDSYAIPGGEPHAAFNDGDETVRGVEMFSPPRERANWGEDEG